MSTLTPLEYVAKNGNVCPVCRSDDIQAGEIQIPEGGATWQPVKCNHCGSTWNDVYELIKYDNLVDRHNPK